MKSMKKVSFSISDAIAVRLKATARDAADGNESLLTDLALRRLLELPSEELSRLVARQILDRMASTRNGWNLAFWLVLGDEFGRPDMIDNPYAPRNYGEFYVVLLLNHSDRVDDEDDPFNPYIGPRIATPQSPSPQQWQFNRSHSPVNAAETVATRLRELGVPTKA